jgi:raffinose/stachyose/melibiose transport system permease protein
MRASLSRHFLLFAAAAFAIVFIVIFIPFVYSIYLSCAEFSSLENTQFNGLSNYIHTFTSDENFKNSLIFSAELSLWSLISVNVAAFALAFFLTRTLKNSYLVKLSLFLPGLLGTIAGSCILQLFFDGAFIPFGAAFTRIAGNNFVRLFVSINWQLIGFITVIYVFAMVKFHKFRNVLDAAKLEGMSVFGIFWHIRAPAFIRPIIICSFLTLLLSFIFVDRNIVFSDGKYETAALNAYNSFYLGLGALGLAQSKACLFFIVSLILVFVLIKTSNGGSKAQAEAIK